MHQLVMGSLILMCVTLGWGTSSVGQEVPAQARMARPWRRDGIQGGRGPPGSKSRGQVWFRHLPP
jgi:hypothetical protein